jgi:CBS domain-containing protein
VTGDVQGLHRRALPCASLARTPRTSVTRALDRHLADLLATRDISGVPVLHGGRLAGVVSSTDLLSAAADSDLARELMSSPPIVARSDEAIEDVAWRMSSAGVHRLLVVDGERLAGLVSAKDLLEEVAARRFEEPLRDLMRVPVECVAIGETIDTAVERLRTAAVHGLVVVDGLAPGRAPLASAASPVRATRPRKRCAQVQSARVRRDFLASLTPSRTGAALLHQAIWTSDVKPVGGAVAPVHGARVTSS